MAAKSYVIALEEHYLDPEVKQLGGPGAGRDIVERLDDLGALRLKEMDEAGIDLQGLSHSIPGLQGVDAATGVPLARRGKYRPPPGGRAPPPPVPRLSPLSAPPPHAPTPDHHRPGDQRG